MQTEKPALSPWETMPGVYKGSYLRHIRSPEGNSDEISLLVNPRLNHVYVEIYPPGYDENPAWRDTVHRIEGEAHEDMVARAKAVAQEAWDRWEPEPADEG